MIKRTLSNEDLKMLQDMGDIETKNTKIKIKQLETVMTIIENMIKREIEAYKRILDYWSKYL